MQASNAQSAWREPVAQIELSPTVQLRVTIDRRSDEPLIDFWACTRISISPGIFMPTANGFGLSRIAAQALIEALQAALALTADSERREGRACP